MSQIIKTKSALLAHVMKTSFVKEYVEVAARDSASQRPPEPVQHPDKHR